MSKILKSEINWKLCVLPTVKNQRCRSIFSQTTYNDYYMQPIEHSVTELFKEI